LLPFVLLFHQAHAAQVCFCGADSRQSNFRKLKTSVTSAELRAKMCKAGSSSSEAVQALQKSQQQRLSHLPSHAPQSPQEPVSAAAAAAAAAAADAAAALKGPITIPALLLEGCPPAAT